MAIKFSRDPSTGAYMIHDTETHETRLFESERLFLYEAFSLLIESAQKMEESIDRLHAKLVRKEAQQAADVEVWP